MSEVARLYYDGHCGVCSAFARLVRVLGGPRVCVLPFTGPEADRELSELAPVRRYDSMHLVRRKEVLSAADAILPLVETVLGRAVARGVRALPPTERAMRWAYWRVYRLRASRGCLVPSPGSA